MLSLNSAPAMSAALSDTEFNFLRNFLCNSSGIILDIEKMYLIKTRLANLALQEGFNSIQELIVTLYRQPSNDLQQKVINSMTINETSFFRDVHLFQALEKNILPDLIEKRRALNRIDIWSAACSTGQEPYSIAMLIKEYFLNCINWKISIIGSDISSEVLFRARNGCYTQHEVNRGLPLPLLIKYFNKARVDWEVKEEIRQMVEFRCMNLLGSWPSLPMMDLIFLRNVFIYFDVETKKKILNKLHKILKPDGYLFLGGSETLVNLDVSLFEIVSAGPTVCYRPKK